MGPVATSIKCDLCGLPLRFGNHSALLGGKPLHFCCSGCLMVYTMLMEATDSPDPESFRQSDLYRRCVAAGVVPATEDALAAQGASLNGGVPSLPSAGVPRERLPLQLRVEGMWCPACSWVIQAALERLDGVDEAVCDFATDRLRCRYDPVRMDPDAILDAVNNLGYTATTTQGAGQPSLWRGDFVRLMICALLSSNVMMLSYALYSGFFTSLSVEDIRYISWPILVMAAGVMVYGGGPLFRKAWWGLKAGAPGMEVLVCMGAASAFLYSLYNFWADSWHLYFDTASMLITLVLLGKFLEAKAKAKVREDLEGFLVLQPNKVRLCSDGFPRGRFVSLEQLAVGDRFRVKVDEMVPADGRVTSGRGLVDLSALTGESRPKVVDVGDPLDSGSRLIEGDVTVTAERVGEEALVGQMIAIIESGLSRRTPLESRTDRWLAWFVPVMAGLAAVTVIGSHGMGLVWEDAFVRGLTVLVVACPCALGIAIPLARIAGMSGAGRMGILVRDFEAFERVNQIDNVVVDKTGTLTYGRWSLEQVTVFGQAQEKDVLALAAALEANVDHAVARAVLAHAAKSGIVPEIVEDVRVADSGVSGTYQGCRVALGAWEFVRQGDLKLPAAARAESTLSLVFLVWDGKVRAMLGFGDKVREGVAGLIATLSDGGYGLHLISGDGLAASLSVGRQVGIDVVHGALLPTDKADYVGRLQADGHRVMMVGDGINDAPALAKADLSVAVHRDASLARQAANVTLMRGDPTQLMDFWKLAQRVNGKVVQNLGCAWMYNLVSIPIAMSGLLNPLIAATAMLLSSLTVIGNTLLLVKKKRL